MNEFDLINRYFKPLSRGFAGADQLNDDAAVLSVPEGHELVVTSDALNQGVHFFPDDPPDLIARKALRVNLSDLAAKGARPYAYQLNLSLLGKIDEGWIKAFCKGLEKDQKEFGIHLCGGDTTRGALSISITAFGFIETGRITRRGGARQGDAIFVSGTIGDAYLGLKMCQGEIDHRDEECIQKYQCPMPRVDLIRQIKDYATASMDISDGLILDIQKLCQASEIGAKINMSDIPLSPFARKFSSSGAVSLEDLLSGGDDYEVLFTAPSEHASKIKNATRIGIISGGDVVFLDEYGQEVSFSEKGWEHHF